MTTSWLKHSGENNNLSDWQQLKQTPNSRDWCKKSSVSFLLQYFLSHMISEHSLLK